MALERDGQPAAWLWRGRGGPPKRRRADEAACKGRQHTWDVSTDHILGLALDEVDRDAARPACRRKVGRRMVAGRRQLQAGWRRGGLAMPGW